MVKKTFRIILIISFFIAILGARQPARAFSTGNYLVDSGMTSIDPGLKAVLASSQGNEMLTVIVKLRQQADLSQVNGADHAARLQGVIRALQATAGATQGPLNGLLKARQAQGSVARFEPLWVFNAFSVTATPAVIAELASQPDVLSITPDDIHIVEASYGTPEANISLVGAPSLWDMGVTGQGVVVASMDSGVDVSHPDLATRWRGGSNSWFDPYGQHPTTPTDLSGHGTWTMGIMVGGDAGGTSIGAAPSAQWAAVKIFDDQGGSTATAIHQGFQWLLDPDGNPNTTDAPQVVNNSWTFAYPGCNLEFEPDLESLSAAGILPVFAAGNGGPYSDSSYSPANNPAAFAVGATDDNDQIYGYSSRGPTTCGGSTGPYPEMVAPGVNVLSSDLLGGYQINSGTSLAAPHVAGGLALLLSVYPNLTATDQANALTASAVDLGVAGPDDVYGYGRLDLLAAFNWLASMPTATPTSEPTMTPTPTSTFTPTPTPTFTPTPAAPTRMHVGDLDGTGAASPRSRWDAIVTITVHDDNENPVANATVSGTWSNGAKGNASCTTDVNGVCQVAKTGLSGRTASVTFTVTNVSQSTLTYVSSDNHDPDGDSNGTSIDVAKP
jgi:serine protease AprX